MGRWEPQLLEIVDKALYLAKESGRNRAIGVALIPEAYRDAADLAWLERPLYELDGNDVVIIGQGVDASDLQVTWSFFDDGELLATGDFAPYVGKDFAADPAALARRAAWLSSSAG